jgi:hypothetical protein
MLMAGVEIRFDPALVEEAVFLELKRREVSGDRRMAKAFHAQRSGLYGAGAAEERETRFRQLAERYFHELGLSALVTTRFAECPLVAAQVQVAAVQRVWSRKEEHVELYMRPTTLLLGLQAACYLHRDALVAFLRHELMHISDMLDPAFAYDPHPEFGGMCETEDDLVRERFRVLWNVVVDSRLRRRGWQAVAEEPRRRQEFERAFSSWLPTRRHVVFEECSTRAQCTQRELLDLAKDERLTQTLGAGGVRCPLCHFPTRDGVRVWDGEWAPIAQAIHADYPDWTPAQGACVQCADLYRSRVFALH